MTAFGRSVRRVEDADLLTGRARFVDDIPLETPLHLAVKRSVVAHATVTVDTAAAATSPGVVAVWSGSDLDITFAQLLDGPPPRRLLADGKVRYVGEPVAAVLAENPHLAWDALDAISVDYDILDPVIGIDAAIAPDAPLVYDELDSNVAHRSTGAHRPDPFAGADVVVATTVRNHRMAPGMLEPRAIAAAPEGDGLVVWCSHQAPHRLRDHIVDGLGLSPDEVRVITPEVGGGFGAKGALYPEYLLVAHAARTLGRPVKYIESRSENLLVTHHGRAQQATIELGATNAGDLVGIRIRAVADFGAAIDNQRWCVFLTEMMLSGAYRFGAIDHEVAGVLTTTSPVGAFRGAGRPEAAYAIERAMDALAARLDIDPAELRRRNFIPPEAFPYDTGLRSVYDSGDYRRSLDLALEHIGYDEWRAEQRRRTESGGAPLGIGIASYVELSGGGEEYGAVTVAADGSVTALTGTSPHGQGHHTTWAQIVADHLGLDHTAVTVVHGDTLVVPRGGGTAGSRSAPVGGSAINEAAESMAVRLRTLAAEMLEAAPEDIELRHGSAVVAGTDIGVSIAEIALHAESSASPPTSRLRRQEPSPLPGDRPSGVGEPLRGDRPSGVGEALREETVFVPDGLNYPFGTHVCVVEIDEATGTVSVVAYVSVDDCGTVINPMVVEAQIHGGIVQGVSHALAEQIVFDDFGNLVTGNWASYLIPTAAQIPPMVSLRTETPATVNPRGIKGVGEAGATGSTPAVANAVADALRRRGVDADAIDMPYTPAKVWAALREVTP